MRPSDRSSAVEGVPEHRVSGWETRAAAIQRREEWRKNVLVWVGWGLTLLFSVIAYGFILWSAW